MSSSTSRSLITITALLLLVSGLLLLPASRAGAAVPAAPTITSKPAASTNSTSATFAFTRSEAGGTLECAMDDPFSYATCSSPASYSGLTPNNHTFYVRQLNADGASPAATYTWTIDTTAPANPVIAGGPAANTATNQTSATFGFAPSEAGGTMECALDDITAYVACSTRTSQTYSALASGSHTFYVRQRDDAGNTRLMMAYRQWKVDTTPPSPPTLLSYPDEVDTDERADFSGTAFGGPSFESHTFNCQLDSGPWELCTLSSAGTFSASYGIEDGLVYGPHTFRVVETDEAGNVGTPTVYTWTFARAAQPIVPVIPVAVCTPAIVTVDPSAVMAGQRFALTGASFGTAPGAVTVAGIVARVEHWSDTQIVATVPVNAPAGKTVVLVGCSSGNTDTIPLEVLKRKNLPPVAIGFALPTTTTSTYRLDGTNSYDPDGRIVAYRWTYKGKSISKSSAFSRKGLKRGYTYKFGLRVRDNKGAYGRTTVTFKVPRTKTKAPVKLDFSGDALFKFDYCTLTANGKKKLLSYRKYLTGAKTISFAGHTDSIGTDAYNLALSQCRANTVKATLLGSKRIRKTTVRGYGESRPRAQNSINGADNPPGRSRNRHVSITIGY
jgi:outer membrane protein OmpA-like peptidoglycan-associated protein